MDDNQIMLMDSIKRYFDRKKRLRRAEPVVMSQSPAKKTPEPEVLWSRGRRPADLGSLKQEFGVD